ncbi:MAG: methyltransferase domain-containing protein [Firmicutes bacterium]|nr:methyltransferase domain-containing protein [Bacillota bacterium]
MWTWIVTAAPDSGAAALNEIQKGSVPSRFCSWLAPGVAQFTSADRATTQRALRERPPIFVRHVSAVDLQVPCTGPSWDWDAVLAAVSGLDNLDKSLRTSVQVRPLEPIPSGMRQELTRRVSSHLTDRGVPIVVAGPQQVVSIVLAQGTAGLGVLSLDDALSAWPGGECRFKRTEGQVSRAEFKLLEALDLYPILICDGATALDLGAAPGGWTRVLRERGLHVTAVDPAVLDARVAGDPHVRHVQQSAQSFLRSTRERFAVVVNDMKMDARASCALMVQAEDCLEPGGFGVMTLKLPEKHPELTVRDSLDRLRVTYDLVGARQLFHNRSEVTVVLRKREAHDGGERA